MQLFVERARLVLSDFALTEGNASAVVTICRRLDGLPLAIELAAARVGVLPVAEIAARLDDRFRLLQRTGSTVVARQRTRHAAWYLALAERAEPELTGPYQQAWLERLDADHENLRAALEWTLAHRQTEWALRLAGSLAVFWRVRASFSDGRQWLEGALAAAPEGPLPLRAKALWGAGFMAGMLGDYQVALRRVEDSLAGYRKLDDTQG
ncbi:MAG: hypothetical protein ABR525_11375, partial [Candidatus Limnocylindria bacterium]